MSDQAKPLCEMTAEEAAEKAWDQMAVEALQPLNEITADEAWGRIPVPTPPAKPSLVQGVERLVYRAAALESLCGEMLSALYADLRPHEMERWKGDLSRWQDRFDAVRSG